MRPEDEFAGWMAAATLRTADEEIQAIFLDDVLEQAREGQGLDRALADASKSERRPGDFGMEIAGSLLVPVLIEAGRQFWAIYIKKLAEKGADKLSEATIASLKRMVKKAWSGEDTEVRDDLARLIRVAGEKQGLQAEAIEKLVSAIQAERFANELK